MLTQHSSTGFNRRQLLSAAKRGLEFALGAQHLKQSYDISKKHKSRKRKTTTLTAMKRSSRSGKKSLTRRSRRGKGKKGKNLKSRVNKLEKNMADTWNVCYKKVCSPQQFAVTPKNVTYTTHFVGTRAEFLDVDDEIKIWQSDAGVQSAVNFLPDTSFDAPFGFKASMTAHLRNNSSMPLDITIYEHECVADTSFSPYTIQSTAFAEYGIASLPTTPCVGLICPFETQLKEVWRLKGRKTYRMQPGDELHLNVAGKYVQENYSVLDNRTAAYWKGITSVMTMEAKGVVSHQQDATGNVGFGDGVIDYILEYTLIGKIHGKGLKHIVVQDTTVSNLIPTIYAPTIEEIVEAV